MRKFVLLFALVATSFVGCGTENDEVYVEPQAEEKCRTVCDDNGFCREVCGRPVN